MSQVWWPIMAAGCVIGVDLGGTKLLAGTVDSKLEVHHRAYRLARTDDAGALREPRGREHHDVKRIHAPDRIGAPLSDRPGDPRGHVRRDQFDLFAALFAERERGQVQPLQSPAARRARG